MLNRRHIRTLVIQSVYSNSIELIESKPLKTYVRKCSSISIDLLYCIIDLIKDTKFIYSIGSSKKNAEQSAALILLKNLDLK